MTDTLHTATVDGFTHGGEGVVRLDGRATFVAGALPGERITLRIVEEKGRWARGELVEVLDASPDRVEPPCAIVAECGGCDLQHVSAEGQVRLKAQVVTEQLQRIGKIADPPVLPGLGVGSALRYRTHARFHAAADGRLGFHRRNSNDVVPIDECIVLSPAAQALLTAVGAETGAVAVTVRADGVDAPGRGAVVLEPGPGHLAPPPGDFDLLLQQPSGRAVAMRGDGVLHVEVDGLRFEVPADAFFQVSTAAAEALVSAVMSAVGSVSGHLAWDLYSGVGLLALPLARAGAEVVAVEGNKAAAAAAVRNAAANGLDVTVEHADVKDALRRWAAPTGGADQPDVVVLDPPRTGIGAKPMRHLLEVAPPRIVIVACDPAALARDAAALVAAGYKLRQVQPLDLFPMTHHVEAVALLER